MLEARDVTFGYPGKEPVLHGFSLAVEPGERVAVAAPSGGGKTTLCRLLAGYEQPQAGQVLADGALLPRRGPCPAQMIGQHPELMLDPRMTMGASLAEAVGGKAAPGTAADAQPSTSCAAASASGRNGSRATRASCRAASCSASASCGRWQPNRATW